MMQQLLVSCCIKCGFRPYREHINIEKAISLEPNNKIPYILKPGFNGRQDYRVIAALQSAISIKEGCLGSTIET